MSEKSESNKSAEPAESVDIQAEENNYTQSTDTETPDTLSTDQLYGVFETAGQPVVTASTVAKYFSEDQAIATEQLSTLVDTGVVNRVKVDHDPVVYYPASFSEMTTRERIVVFPDRQEIIVDNPTQYTRAQLTQFAHLVDTTGERKPMEQRGPHISEETLNQSDTSEVGTDETTMTKSSDTTTKTHTPRRPQSRGYLYRVRQEDIWQAPFDDLGTLISAVRSTLPRRVPALESWIETQWNRANRFRLFTHDDGYVVLEAASESLMGNVAEQKLDEEQLVAPISDTQSWVRDGAEAAIKRTLYEAGYPVIDERELETGEPLAVTLEAELRSYQQDWVDRFLDQRAGVLVGPSGSGKTVTAIGALASIGGETIILVPSRELASQWRAELTEHTDLSDDQIGEYHGGNKTVRQVTIATYQTAGMDRHRSLFDSREWGLIIYDEVHHIPAAVYRRSADLQAKHRLGLSATPVREDDKETEIFTLVGPPIGTDWSALFEEGYVQEPYVEIQYVPWKNELSQNEWANADGRDRRRLAAENPQKIAATERLLQSHSDASALVFVEWLDHGESLADAVDAPFVSGEMPHYRRDEVFELFREGEISTLVISRVGDEGIDLPNAEVAVVASGLGGSRRQGAQRAGRTMRPAGSAEVYVLATRGTTEEEFAQRQLRHLAEKGIRVTERNVAEEDVSLSR
ncbi:DEAD/DEAH box helicase [Haloquadratum walsbyi]|jgi:DNA or RNA helicases of superfamily II|uniref:Putative DNA 3'-5' helicase Rad25 n=1 Tax=Haloquadratum walsbyi J07HQW2 TaxID=1238425 RepID=U1NCQ4_9EURY|nr:DEAD/DEAH box helicase [Haloquadratum walsbyi]ERG94715.1 MAG: DNA or RNA helicase of superfamily II [Haloquadratum walsbyi J07HQW2]